MIKIENGFFRWRNTINSLSDEKSSFKTAENPIILKNLNLLVS